MLTEMTGLRTGTQYDDLWGHGREFRASGWNPLFDAWAQNSEAHNESFKRWNEDREAWLKEPRVEDRFDKRVSNCHKYAWAVPDDGALSVLLQVGPIVEIGAGTGYWARLLRDRGADVIAYDIRPARGAPLVRFVAGLAVPKRYRNVHTPQQPWTKLLHGHTDKADLHPGRTLFLCWPPYAHPMADNALRKFKGHCIVYIGEGVGGCTGNDEFHDRLEREWSVQHEQHIPQWFGLHDYLTVYERQ